MPRLLPLLAIAACTHASAQPALVLDGGVQLFDSAANESTFLDMYPKGDAGTHNGYVWRIHTPQEGRGGGDWMLSWLDAPGWDGGPFSGDSVLEYGYNIHQPEGDKPQWSLNLESYFQGLSEFHLAFLGPQDGTWTGKPSPRVISSQVDNATGLADIGHQVNRFYLQDSTGSIQPFVWDMTPTSASATVNNAAYVFFSGNNYVPMYQEGADGAARALLYLDSSERVRLAPFGRAGLPADTTITDTGGNNPSGLATVDYVDGGRNVATFAIEVGRAALNASGLAWVGLHFAASTPVCTCADETAAAVCSTGTPTNSQVSLSGTASHVLAYHCIGPK